MWFSTYGGGISRFDGKQFVNFTEKEGLPNNITRPMIEAADGTFWIGTMGGGLCNFNGKTFRRLKDSSTTINDKIYTVMQSRDSCIWFGADNGLYVYNGKKVIHFTEKEGLPEVPIMNVFQDSKGFIWISSWEHGVYCYDPKLSALPEKKSLQQYTQKDGLSYHTLMAVNEDAEGNLWFSTFKGVTRVSRNPAGMLSFKKSFSKFIDSSLIYMVVDDKKGNLWFATTNAGMIKYNKTGNTFTRTSSGNGLPGDVVLCLTFDKEDNLWISHWGLGVSLFSGGRFVHYTQKEGLPNDIVNAVVSDGKNGLIINATKGIYRYSAEKGIELLDKQLQNYSISAMAIDDKGVLWLGTNKELIRYENGRMRKFSAKDGISSFPITSITCENNTVWMGAWSGGLCCYNGSTFKNYTSEDGLSSQYIYTSFKSRNGKLYVGTWDGGLCEFDGKRFNVYTKAQGLPGNNVISIAEDREGVIWAGTFGGGICRFKDGKFISFSTKDGLSDDAVVALVFDSGNNLFVASSKGLNKLDVDLFEKTGKIKFRFYGKEEGFTGLECNRNAAMIDEKGDLWFGTKKGLAKYNAADDRKNAIPPSTYITSVKLFFENTDWKKYADSVDETGKPLNLSLGYQNNHLTFEFIGISLTVPEKVQYRYMLTGVDKDWSPATDKTDVTYSGIAPGDYTFRVMACNNEGIWGTENVASFNFSIEPPFWKRTWFYILCVLVLISASLFYTRWKTGKLARENKVLEEKVIERTAKIEKQKNELEVTYREIENKNGLLEQKNRDITDSINYARRIQQAILPLESDIKRSLPQSFVLFKPRDIVSGDFYWFAQVGSKSILAVVDCTGHGVPGAFMSMIGNSLLNEIVYEKKIYEPAAILDYLNEGVRMSLKQNQQENETQDGMDISLISIERNILEYAGAHRPLYLIRNGVLEEISADKFPIGGMQKDEIKKFVNKKLELKKGDSIYMFSDGYVDQFGGEKGKKFMSKRFQELLLSVQEKSMEEQKNILNATIETWKNKTEQVDDILVAGVRVDT
jgi:ligand-binding sensor domain-containing protein/serine phosphatase RsbU (regulator of sigma subunit)